MPFKNREDYNSYQRKWYADNKQVFRDKNDRNRARIRAWMDEQKNKPCMDCERSFPPVCMDWDHRPGTVKLFDLSSATNDCYGIATLQAEIDKCDLVCACCHRIRTAARSSLV